MGQNQVRHEACLEKCKPRCQPSVAHLLQSILCSGLTAAPFLSLNWSLTQSTCSPLQSQRLQKAEEHLARSYGDLCGLMNVNFSRTLPAWEVPLSIKRLPCDPKCSKSLTALQILFANMWTCNTSRAKKRYHGPGVVVKTSKSSRMNLSAVDIT